MHPKKPATSANAMLSAISILEGEHASYTIALKTLLGHLDYARAHADNPKLHIFATGLSFIDTFIDHFHHPKEDEFLFRALRKRTGDADEVLRELQFDHAHADSRFSQLKAALDQVQSGGIEQLDQFAESLERYTHGQFAHMELEDRVAIPLACRFLAEDDWREIDRGFRANRDPMFGVSPGGKFGLLFPMGARRTG